MGRSVALSAIVVCLTLTALRASPQQPQPQQPPPPARPGPAQPAPPAPGQPGATTAPVQAPLQTRTFTAPAGLLFNTVRPERVADFEKVLAYLQAAFEKSTDERVRAQAAGWRVFKATEVVNGAAVYVYLFDPTVVGADYGIGKILADTYPDQAEQLWKLYRDSVSGGGSLLNLTPVKPVPPPPLDPTAKPKPDPTAKPNP